MKQASQSSIKAQLCVLVLVPVPANVSSSPSSALLPVFGGGLTYLDYRKTSTLILSSLLEDLGIIRWVSSIFFLLGLLWEGPEEFMRLVAVGIGVVS